MIAFALSTKVEQLKLCTICTLVLQKQTFFLTFQFCLFVKQKTTLSRIYGIFAINKNKTRVKKPDDQIRVKIIYQILYYVRHFHQAYQRSRSFSSHSNNYLPRVQYTSLYFGMELGREETAFTYITGKLYCTLLLACYNELERKEHIQ